MTSTSTSTTSSATSPDPDRLAELVHSILHEAKQQGASAAEASVSASSGLSLSCRLGEVDTLTQHRDRSLGVVVYFGQRKGSAGTGDWTAAAVRDTVAAAVAGARHTAADPANGLADPERLATDPPDLQLDHPWDIDPAAGIDLARDCEASARSRDQKISNSEGASLASVRALTLYGNSHGFCRGYFASRHSLSASVIAADQDGMQRGYWHSVARDPALLQAPVEVGVIAADRALARLGARRLSTRKAPVLFNPETARSLIAHFVAAVSGGALYREASFLRGRLGQSVFSAAVSLHEQPHLPKALGSAPFDDEGVATTERKLVSAGVLNGYVLGSYSARRLGLTTTGNAGGIHNLSLPGDKTAAELLRELGTGLLVTQLMGQGVNLVSGDYSRAAAGFWVENGVVQYPVEECTVAGNLSNLYRQVVATGSDIDQRGVIRCGSLLIEQLVIGGQ